MSAKNHNTMKNSTFPSDQPSNPSHSLANMPITSLPADPKNKETAVVTSLKPIQPTQLWTFSNSLSLLKSCEDPYILDALDEFLLLNSSVFLNPSPFSSTSITPYTGKDLSLRNILYPNVSSNNIKDAEKISKLLNFDTKECLRVIVQTCTRVPEKHITNYEKLKSKLPDDREKALEDERISLYTSKILKERRTILQTVVELLNSKLNITVSSTIQNLGKNIFLSETYTDKLIDSISATASSLINQSFSISTSDELNTSIYTESILFLIESLKVLVELIFTNKTIKKETVLKWFDFMHSTSFILDLGPCISYTESYALIQKLTTIISLIFLNLEHNFDIYDELTYLNDAEILKSLNKTITDSNNTNCIISYSWAFILLKKDIIIEEESLGNPPLISSFLSIFSREEIQESLALLNRTVSPYQVFESLSIINNVLQFDNIYASVLSSLIIAVMPLVELTPSISATVASVLRIAPNSVIQKFFDNESCANAIILSRAKFPISLSPFLRLASINGNFALHEFQELKSYMSAFNKREFSKLYEIDDENTDLIELKESLDLYPPFEANKKLSLLLGSSTKGQLLPATDNEEILVAFLYNYNGWAFLGRILQNISIFFDNSDEDKVDAAIDILSLLNKTVEDNSSDDAKLVLEAMSAYTDDSDIIEVILRLFEQGLHCRNLDILEPLIDLLSNLMSFLSYRIWPNLSKSSILANNGKEGFASIIFGAIETVKGDYKFTLSLIKLVDSLVQNCLVLEDDYPQKSKSTVLAGFIDHLISVFENFIHCTFNNVYQKLEVGVLILDVFSGILVNIYGIDDGCPPSEKATKVFAESSIKILNCFLATNEDFSRSSYPIISMIDSLSSNINTYELSDISGFWHQNWIRCGLGFSELLISIRSSLDLEPSTFEKELFGKLPQLVDTYAHIDGLRKNVLDLITSLTNGKWSKESCPSLLSHLGRDHAQILLHSLASDLDNPFDDYKMKISLYDFICAVMDGNQEGLSVLFISGKDVFGEFTGKAEQKKKPISLLNKLKKNVSGMKYYPNDVSLHLVDAIALAFDSWTTARESENDIKFVAELISRIDTSTKTPEKVDDYVKTCYELKLVSKIVEILALFFFTTKNDDCKKKIAEFVTSPKFTDDLVEKFIISGYKPSLHLQVHESFKDAFPNSNLSQFTTALQKRNRFGLGGIYNFALMDRLFKDKQQWYQIREHLIASSINIQYTSSQIASAKSFGALLTAFCRKSPSTLTADHLTFVAKLLKINVDDGIPAEMFRQTFQERIELAFYLLYSIYNSGVKKDPKQVFEIIKVSSELLTSPSLDFLSALTQEQGCNRSLLRIIYIALNLIKDDITLIVEYFSVFRQLFSLIITKRTRNILVDLQNDVYLSRTNKKHISTAPTNHLDDLQLILSILKVFVNLKLSSNLHYEMASLVSDDGTLKALLNLYSFSHLIEVNGENIFAQLSLMFIQQLLSIDIITRDFYSSGLLVVLVQSSISLPIKNGRINISTSPQYHRIWTNGLLPIFVILLSKLGTSVITEFGLALHGFGKQIEYCVESWAKDSSSIQISSALISETSQVLLLYQMLRAYNVGERLDHLMVKRSQTASGNDMYILPGLDSEEKRDDFFDCINNLLKHPKFLSSRIVPSSIEEERILEKGDASSEKFLNSILDEIRELKDYQTAI